MNSFQPALILSLVMIPIALLADPETDRKIEKAAADSYNYRTLLEKQVTVKSDDGVDTLTGTV